MEVDIDKVRGGACGTDLGEDLWCCGIEGVETIVSSDAEDADRL